MNALCTVALLGLLLPELSAQGNQPSQPIDPTAQAPSTPASASPAPATRPTFPTSEAKPQLRQPDVRVYLGTIVKDRGAYVLNAAKEKYRLDHQTRAKNYNGKDVKVTGTLDKTANLIHIQKIEVSPSM
jgi:Protein of unknown function (DUF5818)